MGGEGMTVDMIAHEIAEIPPIICVASPNKRAESQWFKRLLRNVCSCVVVVTITTLMLVWLRRLGTDQSRFTDSKGFCISGRPAFPAR